MVFLIVFGARAYCISYCIISCCIIYCIISLIVFGALRDSQCIAGEFKQRTDDYPYSDSRGGPHI